MGVSPWWLVIVALFTYLLGSEYFPEVIHGVKAGEAYALGLASVLLLFVSILAHEFGHALVARRYGIEVEEIDLWLLGGVSRMRGEAHEPGDELRYALAGPAVTAVVAVCFGAATLLLPSSTPAAVKALIEYQAYVNTAILVLNMLPAFPLDGGRVLRSLLWKRSGRLTTATETAARVGRGFGYAMIAFGVLLFLYGDVAGLWFALIGFFVVVAAGQQAMGAQVQAALSGVHARELMSTPVVSIPAGTPLAQASREYFMRYRYTAFPVVDAAGKAVGLVSVNEVEAHVQRGGAGTRTVEELADRDPELIIGEDDDVARLLEHPGFSRMGRAVVVDRAGKPVGLVSITDVQRALRAYRLAEQAQGEPPGEAHGQRPGLRA